MRLSEQGLWDPHHYIIHVAAHVMDARRGLLCLAPIVFTRHSLARAKGEVLVLLFFCSLFLSTISRQPAGRFMPNFACGRTLVTDVSSLLLGVRAPGAEKREMKFSLGVNGEFWRKWQVCDKQY